MSHLEQGAVVAPGALIVVRPDPFPGARGAHIDLLPRVDPAGAASAAAPPGEEPLERSIRHALCT